MAFPQRNPRAIGHLLNPLVAKRTFLLFLALVIATPFFAQFSVNVLDDTPDANPGDGVCADGSGNCSLRAAIMEANALPGDNDIILPNGEYVFTIAGSSEDNAATGDLDILEDLIITGGDTRLTIIRADSLDRVFDIFPGIDVTIEFLEIHEGSVFAENGGAIRNQGTLSLHELSIFTSMCEGDDGGQQGGGFGGAIYNAGSLELNEVTIASCLALGGKGAGGVAPGGGSGAGAGPGLGGAVYNDTGASAILTNCTLSGNTAQGGKGGNGTFHQGSGTVASAGGAGGGFGGNAGPAGGAGGAGSWGGGGGGGGSISGAGGAGGFGGGGGGGGASSWGGNAGPAGASGLYGGNGGQGCCSAGSGGGGGAGLGGAFFDRGGTVEVTNCTFAFNQAIGGLGGSGWFSGPGAAGVGGGGAIFNLDGENSINNSLFAENTANTEGPSLHGTFDSDSGHNLADLSDATLSLVGNTANNLIDVDPFILALANNGGNTDTHLLEACDPQSPAIDAGNDAFAPTLDQISQARTNVSEIGSLEILAQTITLLPADTTLCFGENILLDVTSDDSVYAWDNGSTESTLFVEEPGTYSVVITQNGCNYSDEILVEYNALEFVDLGEDQAICPGGNLLLDAGIPGAAYEWQDGAIGQTYLVTLAGDYSVVVTLDDCSVEDNIEISEVEAVELDLGEDLAICEGETAELSTDVVADEYLWNTDESTPEITVADAGVYSLVVTIDGCVFTEDIVLDVFPIPSFSLGADQELCNGEQLVLDVSAEVGFYQWQDGSTQSTFEPLVSGTYSVNIIDNGCTGYDEVEVLFHPLPVFNLGADQVVCYSSNFQLEVVTGVEDVSVLWSTGQNSPVIFPTETGIYTATASANGCLFMDEVSIEVIPALGIDLGPDQLVCKGSILRLNAEAEYFNYPLIYTWSEEGDEATLDVSQTGTYEVTVESECDVVEDQVDVLFEQCGCFVFVPNAFTPDNDGINDVFSIESECVFTDIIWRIFNRYGELIFESDDLAMVWDGSAFGGGFYVPNGVYVWQVEYSTMTLEGPASERMVGHVSVLR